MSGGAAVATLDPPSGFDRTAGGIYVPTGNPSVGKDPQNWLVIPPMPPAQFWLDPECTGMAPNEDLVALQAHADAWARGEAPPFTSEQTYVYHRERGLRDLFFLARWVLGFDRLQPELHAGLAWAWQCPDGTMLARGPAGLFRWCSIPRGHLKTTLCTIAYAIFSLLRDPNERILIYSSNEKMAKKMYRGIRSLLEGKGQQGEFFLTCFPELRSSKSDRELWSETMLTVPSRTVPYSDASLEASGIGATIAGSHFSKELIDDAVGKRENADQMNKIIETLEGLGPLGDSLETLQKRMSCTPWGFWDPGAHAERYEPESLVARRSMFEAVDVTAAQGRRPIVDLNRFSQDALIYRWRQDMSRTVAQAKKIAARSPYFMSCQYHCYPKAEGTIGFKSQWFRYFIRRGDFIVELEYDGREGRKIPLGACNVFITVDPIGAERRTASGDVNSAPTMDSDYVGITVVAVSEENIWYVLDARNARYNDDAFVNEIHTLVSYYHPRVTAVEGTAGQRWIFKVFVDGWRAGKPPFVLGEWSGGHASKSERIRGLIPRVSEGFLYFRTQAPEGIQEHVDTLTQQLLDGDTSQHDDVKDALAAMQQVAVPPVKGAEQRFTSQLNAWGEDDELLRLDAGSARVWAALKKKNGSEHVFALGDGFFYGQANAA